MKSTVIVASLVLCMFSSLGQAFNFDTSYFAINSKKFFLKTEETDTQNFRLSEFKKAFGTTCKIKREAKKSDYFNALFEEGVILNIGPYHKRYNSNPWVLSIEVNFSFYHDTISFLDELIYRGMNFDDFNNSEAFSPYVFESSLDAVPPGKGYIQYRIGSYFLFFVFDAEEKIKSSLIIWNQ